MNSYTISELRKGVDSIDRDVTDALANYFERGLDPGSFVMACLMNDLALAVSRSHPINIRSIGHIGLWLVQRAPQGSWGSPEIVAGWLSGNLAWQEFQKELTWSRLTEDAQ